MWPFLLKAVQEDTLGILHAEQIINRRINMNTYSKEESDGIN